MTDEPLSIAMVGLRGIPATQGGVERAVEGLSVGLAERGHRPTVYARRGYSDPTVKEFRGVEIVDLPLINTKHLEAISHTFIALAATIKARKFDLVHIHATGPALLSFLPRLAKIPTVATVQGLDWRREKWGFGAATALRLGAWASAVVPNRTIVVSKSLETHYREQFHSDPRYIPNGVDLEDSNESTPVLDLKGEGFLLYLGRLVPEKHVDTLISAYQSVDSPVRLVIAGSGTHTDDYVEYLTELASADSRVELIGPRYGSEKAWLLANAAAFVQPSSIEGLPIALLEALAYGRYPIVSEIPENLEPVTTATGRLGESFPVGNVRALAEAIRRALGRSGRERDAVGNELRRHVAAEYNWANIVTETETVYREAIGHL